MKFLKLVLFSLFVFSCSTYVTEEDLVDMPIVITEIMYNLDNEESCQFIEIKNVSSQAMDLSGFTISGGISYTFTSGSKTLAAQEIIVLTNDITRFQELYTGFTPFAEFSGNLSKSDDEIEIYMQGYLVTNVKYSSDTPWPLFADGMSRSLVTVDANPMNDQNDVYEWRASTLEGGSPGADDPERGEYSLVVNEYFTGSDGDVGFIELYNESDSAVNIGGWYISNDLDNVKNYEIPEGSSIAANGYFVIEANSEGKLEGSDFEILNGDYTIILSGAVDGSLNGYASTLNTYYTVAAHSYGYVKTSCGIDNPSVLQTATKSAENTNFQLGSVIFTEIMYHPAEDNYEYVILKNISKNEVVLSEGLEDNINSWKIKGLDFKFNDSLALAAGEKVILIKGESSDVAIFRANNSIDAAVVVLAYSGSLSNKDEEIAILKAESIYVDEEGETKNRYSLSDQVHYYDEGDWPETADGDGNALVRVDETSYSNCYKSWTGSEKSYE